MNIIFLWNSKLDSEQNKGVNLEETINDKN